MAGYGIERQKEESISYTKIAPYSILLESVEMKLTFG